MIPPAHEPLIWGRTKIGEGTYVGPNMLLGHPGKDEADVLRSGRYEDLDGAQIGRNCMLRANGVVYSRATLADNVVTGHGFLVRENTTVGERTLIGSAVVIDNNVRVGARVSIQTGVYIPTNTVIGDDVFIGPRACITNDKRMGKGDWKLEGVVIEDGARIGANSTLLPGVRIGRDAVVGAGAVVTKDVAPAVVVVGVPAREFAEVPENERGVSR